MAEGGDEHGHDDDGGGDPIEEGDQGGGKDVDNQVSGGGGGHERVAGNGDQVGGQYDAQG